MRAGGRRRARSAGAAGRGWRGRGARGARGGLLSRVPVLCLQGGVELRRHLPQRAAVLHDLLAEGLRGEGGRGIGGLKGESKPRLLRLLVDRGGHQDDGLVRLG